MAVLVDQAVRGDQISWRQLVRRYTPLIWWLCRRYGITGADADDVNGVVWLRFVTSLSSIREPAGLAGWLSTVTRRECQKLRRRQHRMIPIPIDDGAVPDDGESTDSWLLLAERLRALRAACAALPRRDRDLLGLLFADPQAPYAEISATLGIPRGAIGPMRQRCLARLRRSPSLAALAS